jgi:hypothetical protein
LYSGFYATDLPINLTSNARLAMLAAISGGRGEKRTQFGRAVWFGDRPGDFLHSLHHAGLSRRTTNPIGSGWVTGWSIFGEIGLGDGAIVKNEANLG